MTIYVRADSGFSQPEFYEFAKEYQLNYCVGIARNPRLSDHISRAEKPAKIVRDLWKHKNIDKKTTKVSVQVKPHDVVLVRINKGA